MFKINALAQPDEIVIGIWISDESGNILEAAFLNEPQADYPDCDVSSYSHSELQPTLNAFWEFLDESEFKVIDAKELEKLWGVGEHS